MMLLTLLASSYLSSMSIATLSSGALLGYGLLISLIMAIALSSQRWLLWYVLGGVVYWLAVEVIHSLLMSWTFLTEWHGYVAAMGISWLPLFAWVLYRALRYDDVSAALQQQREIETARYIEHSPIYDDDYTPRFE
ncbi:AciT family ciprofloxacin tolerance protein [Psychrobacter sp. BF1]|uniref:AciT family ciprofloxacin tolerance protein n=1 Tax=Psychrobacter sp. BF1 TaxID=2821147 RepID=UPI002119EB90|nr:AciT family ciprofloxacin tolerance protein [Psychrobacter sp. BF1]